MKLYNHTLKHDSSNTELLDKIQNAIDFEFRSGVGDGYWYDCVKLAEALDEQTKEI